jgi:predicted TIM-barrel fold metal-dependent hydrolase
MIRSPATHPQLFAGRDEPILDPERDCSPAARRAMFHDNAVRVYRIALAQ